MTTRILLMISGAGSNARDLIERVRSTDSTLDAEVVAVGADGDAPGLSWVQQQGIPTFVVPLERGADRDQWGRHLIDQIDQYSPDLVILSGFMRLVPPVVVESYSPNLLNTHPAYLPEFPGAHAVADAMAAGVAETGASVIVVDNGIDTGPIVAQRRVAIRDDDTQESLHERIKVVERELLFDVVRRVCRGELVLSEKVSPTS